MWTSQQLKVQGHRILTKKLNKFKYSGKIVDCMKTVDGIVRHENVEFGPMAEY